jgi:ABC-2 type transport system permease protein
MRSGTAWARGYWRMVVWDLADLRLLLPVLTAVLVLQGAGFVLGIGLFFDHIPEIAALFVATGVPVMNLITAGLVFEPQVVADQRLRGSYDFLWSFPVPRSAITAAWYTVTLATALPAVIAALATAVVRYDVHFDVTPAIVPAVLLTSLTGVLMGYAIAHGIAAPMTARLVSISMIFVLFGFSPIVFPASQLPQWLAEVNRWLPFGSMATIMRAALVPGMADGVPRAYLVVAAWAVVSALVVAWVLGRRG